ncbi:MAG TPA: hypothetical protein VFO65_03305, partial [Acidimicrobiales bacterium]|nr:hypothetical protein [Acidimicrobiales bacterium]
VLAASLSVLAAGAVALPGLALVDAAWVLPALGLSVATLALATWTRVEAAAAGLGGLWLASIWLAGRLATGTPAADLAPLARPGQLSALAVIAVAAGVLAARRDRLAGLARLATAREIS